MRSRFLLSVLAFAVAAPVPAGVRAAPEGERAWLAPRGGGAPTCFGRRATIVGTPKGEVIRGTRGPDVIVARGGPDRIYGGAGRDRICAGGGADTVFGQHGRDRIAGGRGRDLIDGGAAPGRIGGGRGADACFRGRAGRVRSCVPVIAAAGDIACDPSDPSFNGGAGTDTACRMRVTSDLLVGVELDAVLTLGDNQYEDGEEAKFLGSYDPSWGRLLPITRPAAGNHDYETVGAAGHFAYFGAAAGAPDEGWYADEVGGWDLLALNSNCGHIGGCGPGSPQEQWLRARLAASDAACTLAYWHHARFSSGAEHGDDARTEDLWAALDDHRADVVLAGHDHDYERFDRLAPDGSPHPEGIRGFVAGTGGKTIRGFDAPRPGSEVRRSEFGVLHLALRPQGYAWLFVSADGPFTDLGESRCV